MTSRAMLLFVAACGIRSHAGFDAMTTDVVASEPSATFRNPLNGGPDPFMTQYDGQYYLLTTQGDALRIWKATSLADLAAAPPVTIWQDTDSTRDREVWAPAIYMFDGRWYVYYTADDGIDDHHRIYVIESDSDDAAGTYHFKAKLEPPGAADLWAIDPVILEQASARYLIWSGAGGEGHNLLYIAPMGDPWTLSAARVYLPVLDVRYRQARLPAVDDVDPDGERSDDRRELDAASVADVRAR
jgi:GH43 family beta-xylosidase